MLMEVRSCGLVVGESVSDDVVEQMLIRELMFFFFQAEDGIRYLVRSRGLGDVYKRQPERCGRTTSGDFGEFRQFYLFLWLRFA